MASSVDIHGGTVWTIIWWGSKIALRFLSNVVLTRLLSPEMFGIAAIGNTLIAGIALFSDVGIQQNVVRSTRNDDSYFQTAWTIQLLRGITLTVVVAVLAKPFAWLYEVDGLATFLWIVAGMNLAMGLTNVEYMRDYRDARLQTIAVVDNIAAVTGIATMVLWAWLSPSHVALAMGALVTTSTFALGTFLVYPRQNYRYCIDAQALADLVGFGKWILISTGLAFVAMQMDRLALGKLLPMHILGFYSIAFIWASTPNQILDQWASRIFFPLAADHFRGGPGRKPIWVVRRILVLLYVLAAVVMYAVSDVVVRLLYTQEYQLVAPMIRQLSVVFMLYSLEQSYSHILIALGRPKGKVVGQGLSIALFCLVLIPAFQWADVAGVIGLLAVTAVVRIVWLAYQFGRVGMSELRFDAIGVGIYYVLGPILHAAVGAHGSLWYQVSVALLEGAIVLGVALLAYRSLRRLYEATS